MYTQESGVESSTVSHSLHDEDDSSDSDTGGSSRVSPFSELVRPAEVAGLPSWSDTGTGDGFMEPRAARAAGSSRGGRLGAVEGWSRAGAGARGGGGGAAAWGVAVSGRVQLVSPQRARRCGGSVGEPLSISKAAAAPALRPGLGLRRETAP